MKKTSGNKKSVLLIALAALALFFFQSSLTAKDLILNRTGTISVTKPDGTVLVIEPHQVLPDIPSGSIIEVLNGGIKIEPSEGFIQIVLGGSVATVKAGDNITASIDPKTAMADFEVITGQVRIISRNTTIFINAGQRAQMSLNEAKGITTTTVKSISGTIEAVTVGVKTILPRGTITNISADAKTRNIHIECIKGNIEVIATEGLIAKLKKKEYVSMLGSAEGEIQTFNEKESRSGPGEEPLPSKQGGSYKCRGVLIYKTE
ncbi:MAG: hypothetical protein NT145_05945 [Elusimicrobia bacterium]|nr:hypothetical protein [Elusimicrobiota bacterium]